MGGVGVARSRAGERQLIVAVASGNRRQPTRRRGMDRIRSLLSRIDPGIDRSICAGPSKKQNGGVNQQGRFGLRVEINEKRSLAKLLDDRRRQQAQHERYTRRGVQIDQCSPFIWPPRQRGCPHGIHGHSCFVSHTHYRAPRTCLEGEAACVFYGPGRTLSSRSATSASSRRHPRGLAASSCWPCSPRGKATHGPEDAGFGTWPG